MKRTKTVKIPAKSGTVTYKKIKETTYVYIEKSRTYDASRKYTIPQRICVGKLAAEDNREEIIPNEKFYTMFPDLRPNPDRCPTLSVGPYTVFRKIVKSYELETMLAETEYLQRIAPVLSMRAPMPISS